MASSTSPLLSGLLTFLSGLAVGVLLSLLLVGALLLLSRITSAPSLQAGVLQQLSSSPLLSSSLLLPLLFLLAYSQYLLSYRPYRLSSSLSWQVKSRHSKRNLAGLPPPFPNAWYRVASSSALTPAAVLPVSILSIDLVLYRAAASKACPRPAAAVLDAYCPHLGAHLGYGGRVIGDTVECPFHGWRFDSRGVCTVIPYAKGRVPEVARTGVWESCEADGSVWVWWDVDRKGSSGVGAGGGRRGPPLPDSLAAAGGARATLVGSMDVEVGGHLREVWEALIDSWLVEERMLQGWLTVRKERLGDWQRDGQSAGGAVRMRLTVALAGARIHTSYISFVLCSPTHAVLAFHSSLPAASSPSLSSASSASHLLFLSVTPASPFIHSVHASFHSLRSLLPVPVPMLSALLSRCLLLPVFACLQRELSMPTNSRGEAAAAGADDERLKDFRGWFDGFYSADGTRRREGLDW